MSETEININNLSPELEKVKIKLQEKLSFLKNNLSEENIKYVKKIFEKTLEKENMNFSKITDNLIEDNINKKIVNLN